MSFYLRWPPSDELPPVASLRRASTSGGRGSGKVLRRPPPLTHTGTATSTTMVTAPSTVMEVPESPQSRT
jgi:hypothetical protein